jgi:methylenetetrahydrofolate reductase (NADPH)
MTTEPLARPAAPALDSDRDRAARSDSTESEAIRRVLAGAQFEVVPLAGAADAASILPAGSTVTVTCSPTRGMEPTLLLAEQLAALGLSVVPHLAARAIRDRGDLADLVARLDAAGIRRVFVIGGDGEVPGAYPDGLSLLRAMEDLGHRFDDVGIPGYPEGHVLIPAEGLWSALLEKQRHATHVATQLCFHPPAISAWVTEARRQGVSLPILLGLPSPVDLARLLRIAARIGVSDSSRYLRKNRAVVRDVLRRRAFQPDRLLQALSPTLADRGADVRGLHLYTFNQVADAAAWRARWLARS